MLITTKILGYRGFLSCPKVFRRGFMSEQQRRHISTLADGETDSASVSTTLSMLASDEHLIGVWERYHLIGSALGSEPVHSEYRPMWTRVRERVAAEPAASPWEPAVRPGRVFPLFPLAAAILLAGVVFAALLAVPQLFEL